MGLVRQEDSMFNTPLFCLPSKEGFRVVQDFRELNQKLYQQVLLLKEVNKNLGQVPVVLNLGAFRPGLAVGSGPSSPTGDGLLIPGHGTVPMDCSPTASWRSRNHLSLTDRQIKSIQGLVVHVDQVVVHSPDVESHLPQLRQVLQRLKMKNLKINLQKSKFMAKEAHVMGFLISNDNVRIYPGQANALKQFRPPTNTAMV